MNSKTKYALSVLGIFLVYAILVYIIRRSMGISSSIDDLSADKIAGDMMNEMIKEKKVSDTASADIRDSISNIEDIFRV